MTDPDSQPIGTPYDPDAHPTSTAEPTFAVYVIAVEDSNEAFEYLAAAPGIVAFENVTGVLSGLSEADAIALVLEVAQ